MRLPWAGVIYEVGAWGNCCAWAFSRMCQDVARGGGGGGTGRLGEQGDGIGGSVREKLREGRGHTYINT